MTFDIEARHPAYLQFAPSWRLMRDAVGGDDDVKAAGQDYLPMKTADAAVQDAKERSRLYAAYMLRAEFPEIVAPTITGHVGLICAQSPTIKLPARMEGLRERATLDGLTLDDLIARVVTELLITGRYGLLPSFDAGAPYLAGYCAESIINWDAERSALSFVVLDESGLVRNAATNAWDRRKRFRLLQMVGGALESVEWSDAAGALAPTDAMSLSVAVREFPALVSPVAGRKEGGGYLVFDPQDPVAADELRRQGATALRGWLNRYRGVMDLGGIDVSPIEEIAARIEGGVASAA